MELVVQREVLFEQSAEEVWRALIEPERLSDWFANDVELDARPGGEGVFRWDDGSVRRALVEEVEEERRFAFRWHEEGREDAATTVEVTLEEVPEGTRLTVVETPQADGPRASALAGEWSWGIALLATLPRLRRLAHA